MYFLLDFHFRKFENCCLSLPLLQVPDIGKKFFSSKGSSSVRCFPPVSTAVESEMRKLAPANLWSPLLQDYHNKANKKSSDSKVIY